MGLCAQQKDDNTGVFFCCSASASRLLSLSSFAQEDFKSQDLPLARIKKIMKADGEVQVSYQAMPCSSLTRHAQMISAEAPVLFAMAAKALIHELTAQAWKITEENKRRTLQVVYVCVVCVCVCVCVCVLCVCVCVARALSGARTAHLRARCALFTSLTHSAEVRLVVRSGPQRDL